jgi:hypothetical protein
MVHALEEVRRVLKPKGKCVDIRPVTCRPALEVFVAGKAERAGEIDDAPDEPNRLAADAAVREVLTAGLYEQEAGCSFEYSYFWRTLEQMVDYFEAHWSDYAILPEDVVQRAQQLVKSEAFDSKLRVRWRMIIAVYGKR